MRCNACKNNRRRGSGRFTLRRHPAKYVRAIKCPACGETIRVVSVEAERRREFAKHLRCSPDCPYPFEHQKDSMRMCPGHPLANVQLTALELLDFDACLNTRRSG